MIREAVRTDLEGLLKLYMQLHDNPFPEIDERVSGIWDTMMLDSSHHVIVAEEDFAKDIAIRNNCTRLMLMTGSKEQSTLNFYERAGYDPNDKKAFVQWLIER